jgi:DUF2934 family protein
MPGSSATGRAKKSVPERISEVRDETDLQTRIALRAYQLYLERGNEPGSAEGDWLQAEQEILEQRPLSDPE